MLRGVTSAVPVTAASGSSGRWGFPAARLNSLQEFFFRKKQTLDFFFFFSPEHQLSAQGCAHWPASFSGAPACRCPPRLPWSRAGGFRGCPPAPPRCDPGAGQSKPGCCGAGWDLPADVSVLSLSAARRVRTSPGDVARRSPHFFFFFFLPSRTGFGGGSVTALRCGEQRGAGKERGAALTPHISSLFLPSTSHLLPYLPCAANAELPLRIAAHP